MGLLDRFKQRLSRTRDAISDGISGIFRGGRAIDQQLLDELEELLYTSDLGSVASDLTGDLARLHKRGKLARWEARYRAKCLKRGVPCPLDRLDMPRREEVREAA